MELSQLDLPVLTGLQARLLEVEPDQTDLPSAEVPGQTHRPVPIGEAPEIEDAWNRYRLGGRRHLPLEPGDKFQDVVQVVTVGVQHRHRAHGVAPNIGLDGAVQVGDENSWPHPILI